MANPTQRPWSTPKFLLIGILIGASGAAFFLNGPGSVFIASLQNSTHEEMNPERAAASTPMVKLNDGNHMPLLGLGTSGINGDECTKDVQQAIQLGYRHIDSAIMYGNDEFTGRGLKAALDAGEVKREDLFIVSKLPQNEHAGNRVEPALRAALDRLNLDYVDLFLVHWPVTDKPGPTLNPPMEETWKGMEGVVDAGLTKSIGISNFSPEKITKWFSDVRIYPAVNQVEVHPHWRNDRLLNFCKDKGIHVTAYGPLTSPGNMAGKFPILLKDETVMGIAKEVGKTPAQVLLRWGLQHGTSVIPEGKSVKHQKENLGCLGWELSDKHYQTLSTLSYQAKYFSGKGMAYNEKGPYYTFEDLWNED
ncbi:hypothetical protein WJX84_005810 [Apatococcus fuscideae]|uniref:NADP-dependent oxidoreductase domain-containing protein n=1 Tax=Apatococcus fuscideae TaxID=2026836 RepID=A0AAW1TAR6_9CHLO